VEPITIGLIGCAALMLFLFIGIPVAFALLIVAVIGLIGASGWDATISLVTTVPFHTAATYAYTPMPLFVFMASLIFASGLGSTMYDAAAKWFSRLPGGLGISTTIASTMFGVLTGSSLVTAAMFTKVSVPEMRKHGYESAFAHGLTCASGVIGMLIPPSMLAIIYGILAGESISKLFMAGIGPGVLTATAFCLLIFFKVKRNPKLAPLSRQSFTWRQKIVATRELWALLVIAFVMLIGIYTGFFTVTEGAAIGAAGSFILVIAYRKMSWNLLKGVCLDTVRTNTMILLLIMGASLFSRFITITGITSEFVSLITESGLPAWGVMAGLMIVYVILGCFLDPPSILSITLPLVLPISEVFGWDPIYMGMLILYTMHIGTITPPVGLTLFATKGSAGPDVALEEIAKGCAPFFILMAFLLLILVIFEPLTVGIARWM
jgi:tripartite ATP-independent transporter DctM subunit